MRTLRTIFAIERILDKESLVCIQDGNEAKVNRYVDSVELYLTDRYLDSMKKITVYDILIAEYTYEECQKNSINLGLDLRGGMNVTLEVSVLRSWRMWRSL